METGSLSSVNGDRESLKEGLQHGGCLAGPHLEEQVRTAETALRGTGSELAVRLLANGTCSIFGKVKIIMVPTSWEL